jgi:hypothetical protein
MIPRSEAAPHALVEDDREWALFGGTAILERQELQERLKALQEEPRPFLATWATTSLEMLHRNPEERVSIRPQELVFERRYGELLEGGTPLTPFIVTTPPR